MAEGRRINVVIFGEDFCALLLHCFHRRRVLLRYLGLKLRVLLGSPLLDTLLLGGGALGLWLFRCLPQLLGALKLRLNRHRFLRIHFCNRAQGVWQFLSAQVSEVGLVTEQGGGTKLGGGSRCCRELGAGFFDLGYLFGQCCPYVFVL